LEKSKSIFYWKTWICRRNICNHIVLLDDAKEAIAMDVKTIQHFNYVELDVQKVNIFAKYDHYKKRCPYTPNDFTIFLVNSLVVMNGGLVKKQ
jgi:hypothetical protein